jgi:hypothetical protein
MTAVSTESRSRVRVARIAGNPRLIRDLSHQAELSARIARSAHRHGGRSLGVEREIGEQETDECGCSGRCVECDPDTYRDMEAELLAGRRDW